MNCRNCGCRLGEKDIYCPSCGLKCEDIPLPVQEKTDDRGMKWYGFLIYFLLFATAFLNIVNGILQVTGNVYGVLEVRLYEAVPGLRIVDIVFGSALVVLGVFALYTRFRLAGFRKDGPRCVYIIYAATVVIELAYTISASVVVGQNLVLLDRVATMILRGILLLVNAVYFGKRDDLFIH